MNNMLALGILVVGAFLIQSALGFFQIKHFGNEYNELKADGRVAIGKRAGRLPERSSCSNWTATA